jgi:Rod binding domain-containing protein
MMSVLVGMTTTGSTQIASHRAPEPRLVRAAREFEAQLMKELLRPMTRSSALTGDQDSEGGGTGALGEFASESLAEALSMQGGFGIANRIVEDVSRSGNCSTVAQVTGNLQINTGISRRK